MADFLRLLKKRGGEHHREVFAEFALALMFLRTEHLAARRGRARLRVVG